MTWLLSHLLSWARRLPPGLRRFVDRSLALGLVVVNAALILLLLVAIVWLGRFLLRLFSHP